MPIHDGVHYIVIGHWHPLQGQPFFASMIIKILNTFLVGLLEYFKQWGNSFLKSFLFLSRKAFFNWISGHPPGSPYPEYWNYLTEVEQREVKVTAYWRPCTAFSSSASLLSRSYAVSALSSRGGHSPWCILSINTQLWAKHQRLWLAIHPVTASLLLGIGFYTPLLYDEIICMSYRHCLYTVNCAQYRCRTRTAVAVVSYASKMPRQFNMNHNET